MNMKLQAVVTPPFIYQIRPFEKKWSKVQILFKTGHKDRCDLLCSVDEYDIDRVSMTIDEICGCRRTIPSMLSKISLYSIGNTINFLDNWLQWLDENYQNIIDIYKSKMSELFKKTPKSIPQKKGDDYKKKFRQQSGQ